MSDQQRYEASKQYASHPCRIVRFNDEGEAGLVLWFHSVEECDQAAQSLNAGGVMFQVEL